MPVTLDRPFTEGRIEYFGSNPDGFRLGLLSQRVEVGTAAASASLARNLPAGARVIRAAASAAALVTLATATHLALGDATTPSLFGMSATTMTAGTRLFNQPCVGSVYTYANNAASAALTASDTATNFDKAGTIPANFLRPGDVIRVRWQGIATATNSTDTLRSRLMLGTVAVVTQAAVDVANNDVFQGEATIIVRAIGASGAIVAAATSPVIGAAKQDGTSSITARSEFLASTAVDTTAALTVAIEGKWSSTNAGNSCRLDMIHVEVVRAGSLELPAETTPILASVTSAGVATGTLAGTVDCFIWFWEPTATLPVPATS